MSGNIYRQLQKQLDQYSLGFPATESGIELDILRAMFTEDEAVMFSRMTTRLESPSEAAVRLGLSGEVLADQLERMAMKGLLYRNKQGDTVRYSAVPFVHGLLEFQVNRLDRHMVVMLGRYIKEKFNENFVQNTKLFLRTIPVRHSVSLTRHVASHDDAREILKNEALIVVTDCACRRQSALVGKPCEKPLEVCFMFGPMGQYYLDNGLGRQVDLDEALQIQQTAHEAGLVNQPAGAIKPFTMCNCCRDCCGFLRAISRHPRPAEIVFSNFFAHVNQGRCTGCEICLDRCTMRAISLNDDGVMDINLDRCIGCGLCVTTCPAKAIELIPKPQGEQRLPARNVVEQMIRLARNRGIVESEDVLASFGF
jgi:Na+-translocating ferredoxin:NAD+ oxidoreductase subunit B